MTLSFVSLAVLVSHFQEVQWYSFNTFRTLTNVFFLVIYMFFFQGMQRYNNSFIPINVLLQGLSFLMFPGFSVYGS